MAGKLTTVLLDQHTRIGVYCIRHNMTLRQLVNAAVEDYLDKYDKSGADNKDLLREYSELAKEPWPRRKDDQEKRTARLVAMERELGLLDEESPA